VTAGLLLFIDSSLKVLSAGGVLFIRR
jgi:hypothetical protein